MSLAAHSKSRNRGKRAIGKINTGVFVEAVERVCRRYGSTAPLHIPGPYVVSSDAWFTEKGSLIYGVAYEKNIVLYSAGFARSHRRGADFDFTALHTFAHEQMHLCPPQRILRSGMLTPPDQLLPIFRFEESVRGLRVRIMVTHPLFPGKPTEFGEAIFKLLNEGVTEWLAREVVDEYLALGGMQVAEEARMKYLSLLENDRHTFYPTEVRFARKMTDYFARRLGRPENNIMEWLCRAFLTTTDLRTDSTWATMCEECKPLPRNFTQHLAFAKEEDFEEIETCYFDGKGTPHPLYGNAELIIDHFADLEVEEGPA